VADLSASTVLVCGARFAGQAAARALLARGERVLITDRTRPEGLAEVVSAGAQFVGELTALPDVDLVVTSPGWRPDHPLLVAAAARGVEVLGEVEFAWRLRGEDAADWLLVTGTNGKTTTVRMLESMLRAAGHRALAVGNVGVSVIDAVTGPDGYDVLAVEVSSYQLYWSSTVRPVAGALLNLAPDHLDWHGSMSAYAAAKARVWQGDVAVANADDPAVVALLSGRSARTFSLGTEADYAVRDGRLVHDGSDLFAAADVRPAGPHNVANALAAAALAEGYADPAAVAEGLRRFVPDPHRNEYVTRAGGVAYIDDSKATNPHAARASLLAYDRIVWIAGGQLKDAPVDELVGEIAPRLTGVVLLGVDRALIAAAMRRHAPDVPVIEVETTEDGAMLQVVRAAAGLARPGDTVLLAPAAASYDMFTGYVERGAQFAAAARALAQ
jgi:UDP-N-acetylmuramoylalanine--D-glutamate ligase